jgi:protein gp37
MKTTIEWTHRRLADGTIIPGYTFNIAWGCQKVSEECHHCYAEGIANRYGMKLWGPAATTTRRTMSAKYWQEPSRWNREAEQQGHRRSVFCSSMADVYENHPVLEQERHKLWKLIAETPWLNWLLLTKRPEHVLAMVPWRQDAQWPDNVWIGTSAGTQKRANERLPLLVQIPAVVRFVSYEPALEQVDFTAWTSQLDWLICGGESGMQARAFDLAWARSVREQCRAAKVKFFFKQVGGRYHTSGGRMLDGRTWDELPPERPE